MKYRNLGLTGLLVSELGLGTMRLPLLQMKDEIDEELAVDLIQYAFSKGINYIDTAFTYHKGRSEEIIGKALQGMERSRIILATKCPTWEINAPDDFDRILDIQLRKMETDYIDCYLFHSVGAERWEQIKRNGLLDRMERAKSKRLIRHIGFSFHDNYDVFEKIIMEYDGWELCQLQYNYIDINRQAGTAGVHLAKEKSLGLVVMEPLHGGRLVNPPLQVKNVLHNKKTPVEWAFDFLMDKEEISIVLSGMSDRRQIDENIVYTSNTHVNMLSQEEKEMFDQAKRIYDSMSKVLCTNCGYCLPCSKGINIPAIMTAFNRSGSTNYRNAKLEYDRIEVNAKYCTKCKICEKRCPQKINISNVMHIIDETFRMPLPEVDKEALKIKWPKRYEEMYGSLDETDIKMRK